MALGRPAACTLRAALLVALLVALCLPLVACGDSSGSAHAGTPHTGKQTAQLSAARKAAMDRCMERRRGDRMSHEQLHAFCSSVMACVQQRLSPAQFVETVKATGAAEPSRGTRVLLGCTQAAAAHAAIQQQFMSVCTKPGRGGGGPSGEQLRQICARTVACMQRRVSDRQFEQSLKAMSAGASTPGTRILRDCWMKVATARIEGEKASGGVVAHA